MIITAVLPAHSTFLKIKLILKKCVYTNIAINRWGFFLNDEQNFLMDTSEHCLLRKPKLISGYSKCEWKVYQLDAFMT